MTTFIRNILRYYTTEEATTDANLSDNNSNPAADLPCAQSFKDLHLTDNLVAARRALSGLAGVYAIVCQVTDAIYIGSSVQLGVRIQEHIIESSNAHLRGAISKHGISNFTFIVVEFVEQLPELSSKENKANILAREQVHLDWLFSLPKQYRFNFAPTAGSCLGVIRSAETKAKMSAAWTGEKNPYFGKTGTNHPKFGLPGVKPSHTIQVSLLNINTLETTLFESQRDAAKSIGVSHKTVQRAMKSGMLIKGVYVVREVDGSSQNK